MIYLSFEELLFLHERIIRQSGGSFGVRNREVVESALLQPFATFEGQEL